MVYAVQYTTVDVGGMVHEHYPYCGIHRQNYLKDVCNDYFKKLLTSYFDLNLVMYCFEVAFTF